MPQPQNAGRAPLPYNPQIFFWIAEYVDGSVVSQFDLDDGHENLYKLVDQSRLRSIGWYPVTQKVASLVKDQVLRVVPFLPYYRVQLGPHRKAICHRQEHLHLVQAYLCLKCGCKWLVDDKPNMLGYPYSHELVDAIDRNGNRFRSPVCPNCKAYTVYICPKCNLTRSRPPGNPSGDWLCLECKQPFPDKTTLIEFEQRQTFYVLGYEEDGAKHTIRIDENGKVEMG